MDPTGITLGGISAIILVTLATQAIKTMFKVTSDHGQAIVAAVVSIVVSAAALVLNLYPASSPYILAGVSALVLWLSATGFYGKLSDLGILKSTTENNQPKP